MAEEAKEKFVQVTEHNTKKGLLHADQKVLFELVSEQA